MKPAVEFDAEYGALVAEHAAAVEALDAAVTAEGELARKLGSSMPDPNAAAAADPVVKMRQAIAGVPSEPAGTAFARLQDEQVQARERIPLIRRGVTALAERIRARRERATASRLAEPDVIRLCTELDAAMRVVVEVNARATALCDELMRAGFALGESEIGAGLCVGDTRERMALEHEQWRRRAIGWGYIARG